MAKKTILVTGGASGFGKETARKMAALGHRIIIANRNEQKMEEAKAEIIEATGNHDIITLPLDLSSMQSVRALAAKVKEQGYELDGLLCNAGISSTPGRTQDGLDIVFESNYLGHFLLTTLLWDQLKEDGRVLLIGSDMHEGLFAPLAYRPAREVAIPNEEFSTSTDRYNFSKLYILYFAYEMAARLKANGSSRIINVFNPGLMHTTNLMPNKAMFTEQFLEQMRKTNHLGDLEHNSTVVCALMTDDEHGTTSGVYYDRGFTPIKSSDLSYVDAYRKELWDLSLELTGLKEEDLPVQAK